MALSSKRQPDDLPDVLGDFDEVNIYGTDPTLADSDSDGLTDGDEVFVHGSDPTKFDSDGDGFSDGAEVAAGTSPLDPNSHPAVPVPVPVLGGLERLLLAGLLLGVAVRAHRR